MVKRIFKNTMKRIHLDRGSTILLCGVFLFLFVASPNGATDPAVVVNSPDQPDAVVGITVPRQRVTLGTVPPGRIRDLLVEEGQFVHEGDILIAFDDAAQNLKTEIAEAQASFTSDVELARVRMDHAKLELKRMARLSEGGVAASKEFNDAKLAADVTRLMHEIALSQHAEAILAYEREQEILKQYHISAPFDGYVTQILKRVGEPVKEREGIITVVQLDPLEVVVDCPLQLFHSVRTGQEVVVSPEDPIWQQRKGVVVFASPVADPASHTFKVKLHVENKDAGWIAGLKVYVDFAMAPMIEAEASTANVMKP